MCYFCSAEFTEFTFLTDHVSTEHEESKHEEGVQICHKCPQFATHFCETCENKLCKFCIIKHYQNTNFTKKTWNGPYLVDLGVTNSNQL